MQIQIFVLGSGVGGVVWRKWRKCNIVFSVVIKGEVMDLVYRSWGEQFGVGIVGLVVVADGVLYLE